MSLVVGTCVMLIEQRATLKPAGRRPVAIAQGGTANGTTDRLTQEANDAGLIPAVLCKAFSHGHRPAPRRLDWIP